VNPLREIVYLDHGATTPVDERVLEAMLPHLSGVPGNPSSLHAPGASARAAVEEARASVAYLVGAENAAEIVFTSGGTEADNLAVFGLAGAAARVNPERRHVVLSAVEHAAVREAVARLESRGWEVTRVGVDSDGLVSARAFAEALRPDTALAALVWANNEVGTVQPVAEVAHACRERGVPLHVDAVQAAGRLPIDVSRVPVSTLALSSHKLYGPQGVGALYVRSGLALEPLAAGGGQEGGLRSGTQNVAGIAGFGAAARLAREELANRARHEEALRERLLTALLEVPGVRLNGHRTRRLPSTFLFFLGGVEADGLVLFLDALGYAVGSGSACASGRNGGGHKASPVLLAMGRTEREAFSALRVTVGKGNTDAEIDGFVEAFGTAVARLREMSPLYTG